MFGQPQPFQQVIPFGQPQQQQQTQLVGQQQPQQPFGQQQTMAPFGLGQQQTQQGLPQQQGMQVQQQGMQMQQQGMPMQQQGLQPQQGFLTQPQQPQQGLQTGIQQQGLQIGQQQPQQGLQQGQQVQGLQPQQNAQPLPEITGSRLQLVVQEQADLLKKSQVELDKFNKNYDLIKAIDKNVLMNVMPQNQQLPQHIMQTQQQQIKVSNEKTFTGKTIQLMKEFQNSQQQAVKKQKEIMEQLDVLDKQVEARKSGRIIDEGDVSIPVAFKGLKEDLTQLQIRIEKTIETQAEIHAAEEKNWETSMRNLSECFYLLDNEISKTEDQMQRLEEMLRVQK